VKLESPDAHVYLPVRTVLQRFALPPQPDALDAVVIGLGERVSPREAALVAGEVMDRLHRNVDDWELVVPFELMEQSRKTQRIFNIVLGSIAGISLLVGGIGIMNIMLASVLEQTREIGVRRAVGARRADIRFQFLVTAFALALIGGLLGVAIGLGIARVVAAYADWPTVVTTWSIALSLGVSIAVGVSSGLYPAVRAARLDPIEALHAD
jgi:putative ABC transport system permease protein